MNTLGLNIVELYIIVVGYIILLLTSGVLVRIALFSIITESELMKIVNKKQMDTGCIIGKCENILLLSFMLMEAYVALALIFTAKSFIRAREMKERNSLY